VVQRGALGRELKMKCKVSGKADVEVEIPNYSEEVGASYLEGVIEGQTGTVIIGGREVSIRIDSIELEE
jgi:hypothetical protein